VTLDIDGRLGCDAVAFLCDGGEEPGELEPIFVGSEADLHGSILAVG
jgi:hypothetical protein